MSAKLMNRPGFGKPQVLLKNDRTYHEGVKITLVRKMAFFLWMKRPAFSRFNGFRVKTLVNSRDCVWDQIFIYPGHGVIHGDRQLRRHKLHVLNQNSMRAESQRAERNAQKKQSLKKRIQFQQLF